MKVPPTWKWSLLGDEADINQMALTESSDAGREFFYIDLGCVSGGRISLPPYRVKFKDAPSRARRLFGQGDVLMATVRPLLGGFGYVDFAAQDCVCSTGFAVIH